MGRKITISCPHCGETWRHTLPESPTRHVSEISLRRRSDGSFEVERHGAEITILEDAAQWGVTQSFIGGGMVALAGMALTSLIAAATLQDAPSHLLTPIALSGGPTGAAIYWLWDFRIAAPDFSRWAYVARKRVELPNVRPHHAAPPKVDLVVQQNEPARTSWFQRWRLDVRQDAFDEWVIAALQGKSLAYAQWQGGGRPFTRNEYDQLTGRMLQAGLIAKSQAGITLTVPVGQQALWRYARERGLSV